MPQRLIGGEFGGFGALRANDVAKGADGVFDSGGPWIAAVEANEIFELAFRRKERAGCDADFGSHGLVID